MTRQAPVSCTTTSSNRASTVQLNLHYSNTEIEAKDHSSDAMTREGNENCSACAIPEHHHKLVTGNFRLLLHCTTIKVSNFYHLGEASLLSLVAASDDLYPIRYHCHTVLHDVFTFCLFHLRHACELELIIGFRVTGIVLKMTLDHLNILLASRPSHGPLNSYQTNTLASIRLLLHLLLLALDT